MKFYPCIARFVIDADDGIVFAFEVIACFAHFECFANDHDVDTY